MVNQKFANKTYDAEESSVFKGLVNQLPSLTKLSLKRFLIKRNKVKNIYQSIKLN